MARNGLKYMILLFLMMLLSSRIVLHPFIIGSQVQNENLVRIEGSCYGTFGEYGNATFSFHCQFPSEWNSTISVPLNYGYHLFDQTVNRTAYYRIDFGTSFFDMDGNCTYQGRIPLVTYKNTGYEYLDLFTALKPWNLSMSVTGLTTDEVWKGITSMTGSITYDNQTFSNSSSAWMITYSDKPLPSAPHPLFENLVRILFPVGFLLVVSLLLYRKKVLDFIWRNNPNNK